MSQAGANNSGGSSGGTLSVVSQVFTGSGTYTPTTGMSYCIIECVGGGGGGGGAAGGSGSAQVGGSGGGGGYARKYATAADIGASKAVTIGAAGAAGTAGNNAGGNGGDTSVGVLLFKGCVQYISCLYCGIANTLFHRGCCGGVS